MSPRVAISAYYFALLAAVGSFYPYFALYLTSTGLSATTATRIVAIVPLMGLVAPPLFGLFADARSARGHLLRALSAATAVAFALFALVGNHVAAVVGVTMLFSLLRAPLNSLADATAFEHIRQHGGTYGSLRLWGSLGYLVLVLGSGALIEATSPRSFIATTAVVLVGGAVVAWRMPAAVVHRQTHRGGGAWRRLLRTPLVWLFLASVLVAQAAATVYDTTFAVYLRGLGHGGTFTGAATAIGVAVEVAFMARSGPILARLGEARALVIAFAVASLRWFLAAHITGWALLLLQPLHAITFGLYWIAATTLMADYAGPEALATGQGLFAAVTATGSVIGNNFGGAILDRVGGRGLMLTMSAVAAVAALGALAHAVAFARRRPAAG